ncbi:MAG: recombinase family protein, partial [Pseudomonadota bacterium]
HYDDGGISGATLERPGLQRLLDDVSAGRVDMIVVYKIDRLTRSLADFARLIEQLEQSGASFVSVTQQFNTSTSMGRLTLNVLLSFAQFEREVTAERIRDKIAASKKKGIWMGGLVPFGYDKGPDGLVINAGEARTVQVLFESYLRLGCVRKLKGFADDKGFTTKLRTGASGTKSGGASFSRGRLYHLLSNPIYIGKIRHREHIHDGQHEAIISSELWTKVQDRLARNKVARKTRRNAASRSPLAGKLFDENDRRMTPSHAVKAERRYRYYVTDGDSGEACRLPAPELEAIVLKAVRSDRTVRLISDAPADPTPDEVWSLIERVTLNADTLSISVEQPDGMKHTINAPYSVRRRGVETKLVLDDRPDRTPDLTMIRRILRAVSWVDQVSMGHTLKQVAEADGVSSDFVTHNIDLAYLSPANLDAILRGRQRPDLTVTTLSKRRWSVDWAWQNLELSD